MMSVFTDFIKGEILHVPENCNHGFHQNCIKKWKGSCPVCRETFIYLKNVEML